MKKILKACYIWIMFIILNIAMIATLLITVVILPGFCFLNLKTIRFLQKNVGWWFCVGFNKFVLPHPLHISGDQSPVMDDDMRYVSVSNHLSFLDIPILFIALRSSFVMKKSILWSPYGLLGLTWGAIAIKRNNLRSLSETLKKLLRYVRGGVRVHIFPEGTRSRNGELLEFKKGMIHKFYKEKMPILCCALWNTNGVVPADDYDLANIKFEPVWVHIGKLVDPKDFDDFNIFFQTVRDEILASLKILQEKERLFLTGDGDLPGFTENH